MQVLGELAFAAEGVGGNHGRASVTPHVLCFDVCHSAFGILVPRAPELVSTREHSIRTRQWCRSGLERMLAVVAVADVGIASFASCAVVWPQGAQPGSPPLHFRSGR